mmetsp:Transcript_89925/g.150296  ORF Transcript_89925/g.150296 Transcript_89925/m.150296 type:complete len:207 (+) Transcript_89925:450-1070(+)
MPREQGRGAAAVDDRGRWQRKARACAGVARALAFTDPGQTAGHCAARLPTAQALEWYPVPIGHRVPAVQIAVAAPPPPPPQHTHTHTHTHTAHLLHLGSSPFCTQGVVSWGWETREDIHTAHRQSAMAESRKNLHLGRHHKEAKRKKCLLWECDRCFSSTAIPNTVFMLWNADGSVQYMPNNQIYVLRTIQSPVWYTGQQQACALQ